MEETLKRDTSQRSVLLDFAQHAALSQDLKLAEQTYQRYLKLDPQPPVPLQATVTFYLAKVARMQQQTQESDKLLAAAQKMDPHVWMFFRPPPDVLFD